MTGRRIAALNKKCWDTVFYSSVDLTLKSTSLRDYEKEGIKSMISGYMHVNIIYKKNKSECIESGFKCVKRGGGKNSDSRGDVRKRQCE